MFTYKFPEEEQTTCHEFERVKKVYRNFYYDTTNSFDFSRQLFFRWRGSCVKLLWRHVAVWIFFYTILSMTYRFVLFDKPRAKQMFELICIYAERFGKLVPITILTAFYVAQVVKRWWDQFMSLPWPDRLALKLVTFVPGMVSHYIVFIIFDSSIGNLSCSSRGPITNFEYPNSKFSVD